MFVDRVTKMVHFAPCWKEVTANEYAKLFVGTVFRLHGMLEAIISDRDLRFVDSFGEGLFDLHRTDLRLGIAFHPNSDHQSKRMFRLWKASCAPMWSSIITCGQISWRLWSFLRTMQSIQLPSILQFFCSQGSIPFSQLR